MFALASHQVSPPGLPKQPNVVFANKDLLAPVYDGSEVRLLQVVVDFDGVLKTTWPERLKGESPDANLYAELEGKSDERLIWITYRTAPGREMPMRRWIHDPDVEGTALKKVGKQGVCSEPLFVPADWSKVSLRLGVPYGPIKAYRSFPVESGFATIGDSKDSGKILISADIPLDPSQFEFIGYAKTKDGKLHKGVVASWNMDDYGRLVKFSPQDFSFQGLSKQDITALVVKIRQMAYVEFKGIPLRP